MIQTGFESKVKVQQIINNQLPEFLLDENPKAVDFFKQYYISQEYQGGPVDITDNLDQYLKVDNLIPEVVVDSATTVGIVTSGDTSITVSHTKGFPSQYGLIKIDDEIITYTSIDTDNVTLLGCKRGFSGITSYHSSSNQEELVFSSTSAAEHSSSSSIQNLSTLFLKEFYKKLKYSFVPGLEDVNLVTDLDIGNFIKEAQSLYKSKGSNESFRILFNVLYGVEPRIVNLEDYIIKPSAAEYVRREIAIAEVISGDPSKLVGQTITKSTDPATTASISLIEAFTRDNKQYFKLEFFIGYDESATVTGTFDITPSTKNLEPVSVGSSVISVDSTVGFAKTGMVISGINSITYTSKSINQFVGCTWSSPSGELSDISSGSNIRSDEIYYGYENGDTSKRVEIRLTGVLSDFVQVSDVLRVAEGDTIFVKNIGDLIKNPDTKYPTKTYKEIFANSWIYNTSSTYEIESFFKNLTLTLKSDIDKSSLKQGDRVEIVAGIGTTNAGKVVYPTGGNAAPRVDFIEDKSVSLVGFNSSFLDSNLEYTLRRKVNKANSSLVPIEFGNDTIISDVQNVYTTTDNEYAYVASNSLPSGSGEVGVTTVYTHQITKNINTASISDSSSLTDVNTLGDYTTITFSDNVPFKTGDRVYYDSSTPLTGLVSGTYYVEVLSDKKKIKLYNSAIFIGTTSFVTFTAPDTGFGTHNFTLFSQKSGEIGAQNLFKKFPLPTNNENGTKETTLAGSTGLLINGVEINNYKSLDRVFYGPVESISVLNGGSNYDVINLPSSTVSTGIGTTALVRLVIGGEIKKVDVDTLNFDIEGVNSTKVSGGNGTGAVLETRIINKAREVSFSGSRTIDGGGVDDSTDQITFLTDHNFTNGQEVIYDANGNTGIGVGIGTSSLVNNASYYVKVDNNTTIQLYPTSLDYTNATNLVGLSTLYTAGIHKFKTTNKRKTISEVVVLDGGSGYTNRKLIVKPAGISTTKNTINFKNHGFNDGDIIDYTYDTTFIEGLSGEDEYYILKIDDDKFQLANLGIVEQNLGSVYFDGSSDHLNLDASSDFAFGTGDFTIECWIKTAVHANDGGRNLRIWNTDGPTGHAVGNLQIMITNSPAGVIWLFDDNSNLNTAGKGATAVSDDKWHHIAVSRESGVLKLFVDGSLDLSVAYTTNVTANSGAPRVRLGSFDGSAGDFDGNISNLRVNKGTALYTKEFVPSRRPLKNVSGTVLLSCKNSKSVSQYDISPTKITNTGAGVSESYPFTLASGKDYYYKNRKPVDLTSTGSGYQNFSYPPIEVSIEYTSVGFGTATQSYQTIVATPIVRGSILDAYVYEGGTGYGSSIINVEREPIISIKNGREAQLKPIIIDGIVNSVNIQFGGFEYYSIPDLEVIDSSGLGSGADLRPVLTNGRISDVKVINAGIGYSSASTSIKVTPSGAGAIFKPNIRVLSVNNNQKLGNEYFVETTNKLQYTVNGYFNTLRESFKDDGSEVSDIIGWAYDGNPIYGPYAYTDATDTNSNPTLVTSGYVENSSNIFDRPDGFDSGFFVEDYQYNNSGDLDEHNGRYGKTKDFPDGIYAYYATIDAGGIPQFPYFIGDSYRTNTLEENTTLDQSFDFDSVELLRNTFPYKVSDPGAGNDFIIETNQVTRQQGVIESVSQGSITDFNIINSGTDYAVGDSLEFDNTNTDGGGLIAEVSELGGKDVYDIQTSIQNISDAIFTWNSENEVKVSVLPQTDLVNNDRIVISGFSTNLTELNNPYTIGITSYHCNLLSTCFAGAATTEIYVSYFPTEVSIGSSIGIGTETMEVLDIFDNQNIIRVKRGLPAIAHTPTSRVDFIPDSFTIDAKVDYFESDLNTKVYFNPRESVGVGTTPGAGVQTSFAFGDSEVTRVIPTKTLYIENHPFKTNQAVTLTVQSGGELQISDTATEPPWDLPLSGTTSIVYITNKTINTIGIRTTLDTDDVFFRDTQAQLTDSDLFSLERLSLQKKGNLQKITSVVSISTVGLATPASGETFHGLEKGDKIDFIAQPNLTVGIGTSTAVRLTRGANNENILTDPIAIDASDINTTTNQITLTSHKLNTGDKISYGCTLPISGLSTGDYYTFRVDDDNIKFCETYKDAISHPPTVISFGSTGGSTQTISPVNPQIITLRDNNLKFDLTDSSLSGYNLKIYYDQEFKNEFVSTGTTNSFIVTGVGTPGVSADASLTIDYGTDLPTRLYYNIEKGGYLSTADTLVTNHSEILYLNSDYNLDYTIVGIGATTFNIVLDKVPERLSYLKTECNSLKYSTTSKTAKGFIDNIKIISGGSGYKDVPIFVGAGSTIATDALIVPKIIPTSTTIGHVRDVRILNEGFEYSSDKTLQPNAQISPLITVKNSNTIGVVTISDGGSGYTAPPKLIVVDTNTTKEIDNGFLEAKLTGNAITSVDVIIPPKGLSETTSQVYAIQNTNGISIQQIEQTSDTEFICKITTPAIGFTTDVFVDGEEIWVEGIQKVGTAGSGFNSEDYGFNFLTIKDYRNSTQVAGLLQDEVTINVSGLTTNTGIAKTIQDSSGSLIRKVNYPVFIINQGPSYFTEGEQLISNGILRDLTIQSYDKGFIKVFGSYDLTVGEIITGKNSGNVATVESIKDNYGRFKVNYSNTKDIGWADDTGKLDEDLQVIPDNHYYQNLSYTVKSPITWDDLQTPVNSMVHTLGMMNFADTGISSTASVGIGSSSITTVTRDLLQELRVDTIYDFDNVIDIDTVGSESKFFKLKNRKLTDYILAKTNTVLKIDDLTPLFSDQGGDPFTYLNFHELDDIVSYENILVRITDLFGNEVQLVDLIILGNGTNQFLLEKGNVANVGTGLTHQINDKYGSYSLVTEEGANYLRFQPNDSYDTDYDLKFINHSFGSASTGVGTTSIGFIDLTGFSGIVTADTGGGSGITSAIVGVATEKYSALHLSTQVLDTVTNDMNFVEMYMTHDGDDTYSTEYYFDSTEFNSYSSNFIGTFAANIDSGNLFINYTNDTSNDVQITSRIVGFGSTSIGIGTYRYKQAAQTEGSERTAIYEANYDALPSSNALDVLTLDKDLFDSAKVTVECGMGKTRSLQTVLMVHDDSNIYVQQGGPSLSVNSGTSSRGTSSGVGTFGGYYDGDNVVLKFYPDTAIWTPATYGKIVASSFSECFYKEIDRVNIPVNLEYGNITESLVLKQYNAINGTRIDRLDFDLESDGIPIFAKTFNPQDASTLNLSTGQFTIENHWFRTGEALTYTPKSTYVGVGSTAMTYGIGHPLPSVVYAIREDDDNFKLATTRSNAMAGTSVSFGSSGEGNNHELAMVKSSEKALITIDNLAQYPLLYTPLVHTLSGNAGGQIGTASTIFALSGISTIGPEDILRIDDEYMKVTSVGLGTTAIGPITGVGNSTLIQVDRGFVGSSATAHTDDTTVRLYKGSYNIIGSKIYFTAPPRGNPQLPLVDISNIPSAKSDFAGRVFLRNDYTSNQIYDDISGQFTGIGRTFDLTVGGANTAGIGTTGGNGIVFINSVFQTPTTVNNPLNNYKLDDVGRTGITSITFSGITTTNSDGSRGNQFLSESDVNLNQVPRGGLIVSLGSSGGIGYAPLIGAEVMPILNASGAISDIVGIGTTLGPVSRSPLSISTASYNNVTGILSVTTTRDHGFVLGITDDVEMVGLHFACDSAHSGVTTTIFPDASNNYPFHITGISSANTFSAKVGVSTIVHNYVGQGTVMSWHGDLSFGSGYNDIVSVSIGVTDKGYDHKFVSAATNAITGSSGPWTPTNAVYESHTGKLTLTIPSHGRTSGNIQIVQESLKFTCDRDNHQTYHYYPRSTDPAGGASNLSLTKIDNDTISVIVGAASSGKNASISAHPVGINTHIFRGATSNGIRRLSGTPGDLTATNAVYTPATGIMTVTTATHSLSAETTKNVTDAVYTPATGIMTVTSSSHGFSNGNFIKFEDSSLTFKCSKDGFVTDHTYPRSTDPIYNKWVAISNVTTHTFEVQVGTAVTDGNFTHTWAGGTASNAIKKANSWIGIATGSMSFTCAQDSHQSVHTYPRITDSAHWDSVNVTGIESVPNSTTFTINVGKSTNGSGGALTFNIDNAGTDYKNPEIYVSSPSYENLEVNGISRLSGGTDTGTGLLLDVSVSGTSTSGIGSEVYNVDSFVIARNGYNFRRGDIIEPIGLVTHRNLISAIERFQLSVDEVYSDSFGAWQFGELDYIDTIENYQDGARTRFPLYYNNELLSFEKQEGSDVELQNCLLIFMNGILQDPGEAYVFEGGTSFSFLKAPRVEDKVDVFFYRGTRGDDDELITDIHETIKRGDIVQALQNNAITGVGTEGTTSQDKRTVFDLSYSDKFETNLYGGAGIDEINYKPLAWTKQKIDKQINGEMVSKARDSIEPLVFPTAKIIGNVATGDSEIFVEDADLFDYDDASDFAGLVVSGDSPVSAAITAIVSAAGTISSLDIVSAGSGYVGATTDIWISAPYGVGIGTTVREKYAVAGVSTFAEATATITNGSITAATLTNIGLGYSQTTPPQVLVPFPNPTYELVSSIDIIQGFSGIVTGITTTTVGVSTLGFEFYLSKDTTGWTGLAAGNPIYIFDTTVGHGGTSIDRSGSDAAVVGIGTTFLDNIYIIDSQSTSDKTGIITCLMASNPVGIATTMGTSEIGKFSWGRLGGISRDSSPISIGITGFTVNSGLTTFPTIQRRNAGIRSTGALPKKVD